MTYATVAAILAAPCLLAISAGVVLLKRAFARPQRLPEEFALAAAWVFLVGSLVWLGAFLSESTLLGYSAPWTWITAAHFAFAGFGALTVTALCCRVVSNRHALKVIRILLVAHPLAYLVTAAGILGFRYCDEAGATSYALIFATQWGAVVLGQPARIARGPWLLLVLALAVPLATMAPALAWAWGRPILQMLQMVHYHGIVNAVGHVGLAFVAFAWGRPPSHSPIQTIDTQAPQA
ncbi:YndJ family transporter [Lacipirellula sp.]|uniref:YndJ family transporter n=1 Tax=Lacipirellula sp. TaxID=2691419 RepID=UPI003D13161D